MSAVTGDRREAALHKNPIAFGATPGTHTVHDPIRWTYRYIGDDWPNGLNPPCHGVI